MPNIEKSAIFTRFIFNMHLLHCINHKSFHWAWKNKPSQTRKHTFYPNQQFFKTDNCLGRNRRVPSNLIAFSYPCFVPIRSESYILTNYFYLVCIIPYISHRTRLIYTIFKNVYACSLSYLMFSWFAKKSIWHVFLLKLTYIKCAKMLKKLQIMLDCHVIV